MKKFTQYLKESSSSVTVDVELPAIYLDMDETIVDWMDGANKALERVGKPSWNDTYWTENYSEEEAEKLKWDILNTTPQFWENLEFMPDGKALWNYVKKYKPHILSACGTLAKTCKAGKMRWLAKNLGMSNLGDIHLVKRSQKKDFAKVNGKQTVLIDDFVKNCQEYVSHGGLAIQRTTTTEVIRKLKRLGFR
jgi:phosphoglycolate phosphatase-like HAD superfamily hydrolase